MEQYPQYSKVILKDGRTATIVEILKENVEYIVDVDLEGPDWETIGLKSVRMRFQDGDSIDALRGQEALK